MANKLKSRKSQQPEPDKLKPEKEEKVQVQQLVRDERTHKIAGTLCIAFGIFLFIAFVSYLFTWKEDQDKVFRSGAGFLFSNDVKVANLLGRLGAWASHFFIYKGFGLASFLLCSLFFVIGVNLMTKKKIFSISRNLRYMLAGLLFFSVTFAFLLPADDFPWGGGAGNMVSNWLERFLGWAGTAVLLSVTGLAYFIWRFNPVFSMPKAKPDPVAEGPAVTVSKKTKKADAAFAADGTAAQSEKEKNYLKSEGGIIVIPPPRDNGKNGLTDFKVVERETGPEEERITEEEEIPIGEEGPVPPPQKPAEPIQSPVRPVQRSNGQDLELEIKPVHAEVEEDEDVGSEASAIPDLPPYEPTLDLVSYKYPSLELLENHGTDKIVQDAAELEANKNQIINTLKNYDIAIQKISATVGPTVTLYEIVPAAGVRISRIKNLEDDIALSLAALGIRIIAPIPGKGTIGIEVPNVKKTVVSMKTLLASEKFQHSHFNLPIALGKKIDNENFIVDLTTMPHLLMAGATGQGKSVGLNAILVSLLYKKHPSQLKLVLVDPKKVELSLYRTIERHFLAKLPGEEDAIITDTKKVIHTLNALCIEMDNRYDLLKEAGARNIKEYNEKFIRRKLNPQKGHQFLPFIVLVVDEFADLIMTAGKEVEMPIARLAQLARAVGIHLIIATQRPSVNIITGTIKANFPARIAFKVSSKVDSRTILDTGGAEQLIGKGDMLISYNGEITRLQCAFVDTPEVDQVTEFIGGQRGYPQAFLLPEYVDEKEMEGKDFDLSNRDPLFEDAARLIVQNQIGSTSLLQRRMKLGYNRAGRLMDQLEAAGIVGPNQGSKARDVLIKTEMDLHEHLNAMG
jgi:S-DNA-T family DNA segregation ATPase FtsK/SpoIIIE